MKLKQSLSFLLFVLFALASCKKDSSLHSAVKTNIKSDTDIYILGGVNSGPVVWKNGVAIPLSSSPNSTVSTLGGIVASGTDIYVSGTLYQTPTVGTALYWKNNIITKLTDGSTDAQAFSVTVSGSDVYVGGYVSTSTAYQDYSTQDAAYWKNGVLTKLTNTGFANARKIIVSGTDVYVLGHVVKNNITVPVYWKNGVINQITDGTKSAGASGIAIQNNNLYIAYSESEPDSTAKPFLWKNGVSTALLTGFPLNSTTDLFLNGNDVYITGYNSPAVVNQVSAVYWKNNIIQTLPQPSGSKFVFTYGVAVIGNDVYIAGSAGSQGLYWKNGVLVPLPIHSYVLGIAVVAH